MATWLSTGHCSHTIYQEVILTDYKCLVSKEILVSFPYKHLPNSHLRCEDKKVGYGTFPVSSTLPPKRTNNQLSVAQLSHCLIFIDIPSMHLKAYNCQNEYWLVNLTYYWRITCKCIHSLSVRNSFLHPFWQSLNWNGTHMPSSPHVYHNAVAWLFRSSWSGMIMEHWKHTDILSQSINTTSRICSVTSAFSLVHNLTSQTHI